MCDEKQLNKKWRETLDDGITNPDWDIYDATIKEVLAGYNGRLKRNVDWKLVKAMLWVESSGPKGIGGAWRKAVMQIGSNKNDPGWSIVKAGVTGDTAKSEGSELILSDEDKRLFKAAAIDTPSVNIRAAIVYLLTRMARTAYVEEFDPQDASEHTYTVQAGDTYSGLQKKLGTTVKVLEAMNTTKLLKPGQVLKYKKAQVVRRIVEWRTFDTATIATRYNGGGDPTYSCKLDYALKLFKQLKPETRR
ncbi:MAG: LysM domain-containing protein [Polyangia bacterium]